jgi:hypothetical protein
MKHSCFDEVVSTCECGPTDEFEPGELEVALKTLREEVLSPIERFVLWISERLENFEWARTWQRTR